MESSVDTELRLQDVFHQGPSQGSGYKRQGTFGGDPLAIQGINLPLKKSVFLEIENLKPVMQSRIRFNINAADKSVIKQEILHTINRVPAK